MRSAHQRIVIGLDIELERQRLASVVNGEPLRVPMLIAFRDAIKVELVALGCHVEYYLMVLSDDHSHLTSQSPDVSQCFTDVIIPMYPYIWVGMCQFHTTSYY